MRGPFRIVVSAAAVVAALPALGVAVSLAGLVAQPNPPPLDAGAVIVSLLERPIGRETYDMRADSTTVLFDARADLVERGGRLQIDASYHLAPDLTPLRFRAKGKTYRFVNVDSDVEIEGGVARVKDLGTTSRRSLPKVFFAARGYAPLSGRALLVRYWERHDRPRELAVVPGTPTRQVRIRFRGIDQIRIPGRDLALRRYTVDGVVWGRETVWLDEADRFAAIVTRIHILPMEGVREDLRDALPELQKAAVADQMSDLRDLARQVPVLASGTFALTGGILIDGTGRAPLERATVLVRDGRIAAVGPDRAIAIPRGTRVLDIKGRTVIPGLWDMHAHASQIEWAPAYLGAGVTTIRDMGGELQYLTAFRDTLANGGGAGPRVLLAGVVDGDSPEGFGAVTAATPEQGRTIVDRYHAAGFEQMKLYTLLQPPVVNAIVGRARELGMSVTGHVPRSLGIGLAIEAGMDHVAHMPVGGDPASADAQGVIKLLAGRHTVIDPTLPWNELLGRASTTPIETFEPGITSVPEPLVASYRSVANDVDAATAKARLNRQLAAVKAMRDANVPIVAGTDGAIPGFSLLRSLELYVESGLTPMEALQAATLVSAKAMRLDAETGTVETGKRADLVVLDADPLANISNIRKSRWVVASGRMYEVAALRKSAGFETR